ncbi:MAG: D-2-hydroxyacid dehydrogenase [Silicimonas sp.]|nr:D-2-hydroxyacid dehydrogenase [Silicimonas sp.]
MTMRTPTVILHTDTPAPALEIVGAEHPDLAIHTCDSYNALPGMVAATGAEVVYSVRFAGTPGFPRLALVNGSTVRWVSVGGSGTDHLAGWDPARLTVTNAAGVAADMMAEYTLGAMLHFSLDHAGFAKAQAAHRWIAGRVTPIQGKRIVILGLGKTGCAIAQRCKAMGLHVTGVRARPRAMDHLDEVHGVDALPVLWPSANFIAICVPLLESTRNLVDATAIARMQQGTVLIDVSRGGVVDQPALAEALTNGHLGGAAIDVFETEPLPTDSPFWDLDNVILTPHCSSVYEGWDLESVAMFSDNLSRYRRDDRLLNIVDPNRGY